MLNGIDKQRYAVFIFGGRACGRTGKAVDIDSGFLGDCPIGFDRLAELYQAIEDSAFPYKVDLVDFYCADPQFRGTALSDLILWNQPPTTKTNLFKPRLSSLVISSSIYRYSIQNLSKLR